MPYHHQKFAAHSLLFSRIWLPLGAGLAALLLYTTTAAPGIVTLFDDSLEFQVVGPTFGIAHPTGYPLYIILGGLWSRVLFPVGEWAWRMNLFSAVTGAAAVGMVAHLGARLVPLAPPWQAAGGMVAALAFALVPVWWIQATVAEVYAPHILLVACILAQTHAIISDPSISTPTISDQGPPGFAGTRRVTDRVALLCLFLGLGLAHHRTTVLLIPAVGLVLLWQQPALLRPHLRWLAWLGALLAPLLLYFWLPWRASQGVRDLHGSYTHSWQGFWNHVLARDYMSFFADNALAVTRTPQDWLTLGMHQLGLPALALGLLGLVFVPVLARRITPEWALIALTLLVNLVFAYNYRVADVEVFLLPAFLCAALLAGMSMNTLLALALGRRHTLGTQPTTQLRRRGWIGRALLIAVLASLILMPGTASDATNSARGTRVNPPAYDPSAHDYAYRMATVDYPPNSRVIGLEGEITGLRYMQLAHGFAPQAQGIVADAAETRRAAIAAALEAGAPAFITREVEGIATHYTFSGAGPLVRVWNADAPTLPALDTFVNYTLEGAPLTLQAAAWERRMLPGGPRLILTLDWMAQAQLEAVYKLSLRLTQPPDAAPVRDDAGQPIVADVFPLRQVALTTAWPVGVTVRDVHALPLPTDMPTGARLQIIVYDAATVAEAGRWEVELTSLD